MKHEITAASSQWLNLEKRQSSPGSCAISCETFMLCHTSENPGALMCESHPLSPLPEDLTFALCYLVLFCPIPLSREFMKSKHFIKDRHPLIKNYILCVCVQVPSEDRRR